MSRAGLVRLTACAGIVLAAWVGLVRQMPAWPRTPLRAFGQVPEFALRDQAGRPVTRASLSGSVWVADFIFTRCAGQCPLMSARMQELQQAFAGMPRVRLVSFSVDPAHDDPQTLAAYARRYGATEDRWAFLTGAQDAVWRLSREGFRLGVGEEGSEAEPITHSTRFALVDPSGMIRGYYEASEPGALRRLQEDVRQLAGAIP